MATGTLAFVVLILTCLGVYDVVEMVDYYAFGDILLLVLAGIFFVSALLALVIPWKKEKPSVVTDEQRATLAPPAQESASSAEIAHAVEATSPEAEPVALPEVPIDDDLTDVEFVGTAVDDELDLDQEFVVESSDESVVPVQKAAKAAPVWAKKPTEEGDDLAKILSKINAIIDMVKDGDHE